MALSAPFYLLDTIQNIISGRVKVAAISLDEIVSSKSRLNRNSLNCSTGLLNFSSKDNTYVYKVVCSEKDSKSDGHKVSIQVAEDPTQVEDKKNLKIKVNCDCPAFLYQGGQYNLSQRDALLGNPRGKLVPPKVRDPVRVNYGCKHVFASVRKLLDKFKLEKPIKPEELEEAPTEVQQELPSPFAQKEVTPEKALPSFKDRMVVERKKVKETLLPKDINTEAVEEMEEDVVPAIKSIPRLFTREESPEEFSTFRPNKAPLNAEEAEETIPKEEKSQDSPPFKKKPYSITPKHLDEEDVEDIEDARTQREKNRAKRQNKVKSLFEDEDQEAVL